MENGRWIHAWLAELDRHGVGVLERQLTIETTRANDL